MATCPECGQSSRDRPGEFALSKVFVPKSLGTWSLSGMQSKTVATERLQLSHTTCGWSVVGTVQGEDFVADREQP